MPPKQDTQRKTRQQRQPRGERSPDKAEDEKKPPTEDAASTKDFQPFPYRLYRPIEHARVTDTRINFWFYVYLYSADVDKLMAPFLQLDKRFPTDRRLMAVMNKSGVRIRLGGLELYKSLPRRVVIMQGATWDCIVRAIFEMEILLPDFMRYASYPILMDSSTTHFSCTGFQHTAGIVRLTQPLD